MKDSKDFVVFSDLVKALGVVEKPKENPPLTAAQAKRAVGRKPTKDKYSAIPDGERADHFTCCDCGRQTPNTEVGRVYGGKGTPKKCIACTERAAAIADGTYRYNGMTFETKKRLERKATTKKYKTGKLPAWMFS